MERSTRQSSAWKYFTKKQNFIASCNICHNDYSYRTSISNLRKHYLSKHEGVLSDSTNSDYSDTEVEPVKKKGIPTWSYFEVNDSEKFEATCKICDETVQYNYVTDLKKHVQGHGEFPRDTDDEDEHQNDKRKKSRKTSAIWAYFKRIDDHAKVAMCIVCKKTLSYGGSVTNLKRHMTRKHSNIVQAFGKSGTGKILISTDGQIYEIETENKQDLEMDNDEKDPIEMDEVYLEDFDDSIDNTSQPKTTEETTNKNIQKNNIQKRENNSSKISKELFRNHKISRSEEKQPSKKNISSHSSNDTENGSLELFGQYVVSLLKQLPSSVCSQLQGDIIKSILTKKIALESQENTKYKITVHENNVNIVNNDIVMEPVTYTLENKSECDETSKDSQDITKTTE